MPELPEVEWMRGAAQPVVGAVLRAVERRCARLPALDALVGRRLDAVDRRGKSLLLRFADDTLLIEPRMTGRLLPCDVPARHVRLRLEMDAPGLGVQLDDPRRLAVVVLDASAAVDARMRSCPAPWPRPLSGAALAAALEGARSSVKAALMDPRRVSGVGNIGASEACWRAGVDPGRRVDALQPAEWDALGAGLYAWAAEALAAIGSGPLQLLHGGGANPFAVYGRAGAACPRCAAVVVRSLDAGRSSFSCPGCQR